LKFRPRTFLDSLLTYPRYLGAIKPRLLSATETEFRARCAALSKAWWTKPLQIESGKRVLVIAPHPDDESIGAGGFLLRQRGKSSIHLLTVFTGDGGGQLDSRPWQDTREYRAELAALRKRELSVVAQRLGAESVRHLDMPDDGITADLSIVAQLRAAVDAVRPEIVLLPWLLDRHPHHRLVNVLFGWGCADVACVVLAYEIWDMLPMVNASVDVSDVFAEKLALVREYKSQSATTDYASMCEGLGKVRAFHSNVRPDRTGMVEGFLALPGGEYCELVRAMYGPPGALSKQGEDLLR
jgi:N-acetylglucosamine malate deacetylase 1